MTSLKDYEAISEPVFNGHVYRYASRHNTSGEIFLIELLPLELRPFWFSDDQFQRETRKLIAFHHPAVLQLIAAGLENDTAFLIKQMPPELSLAEKLQASPLSIEEMGKIFKQTGEALIAAHSQGIFHQNIHPDNIYIDEKGEAFLGNFGITGFSLTSTAYTGAPIIGDPRLLSPERSKGNPADSRTEVFQFGILLYKSLTGTYPYTSKTGLGYVIQNTLDKPQSLRRFLKKIPRGLEGILYKALEKDPNYRIQTIQEFLEKLEAVLEGKAPSLIYLFEKQITEDYRRTQRAFQISRFLRFTGLCLLALLMGFVGWVIGMNIQILPIPNLPGISYLVIPSATPTPTLTLVPTPTLTATSTPTITLTPTPTFTPSLSPTVTPIPSNTPTQTPSPTIIPRSLGGADKVAFVTANDIWISNLDGSDLEQLTTDSTPKFDLQWMPDGESIKYLTDSCAYAINIYTQNRATLACNNYRAYEISPNGDRVGVANRDQFQVYTLTDSGAPGALLCNYPMKEVGDIRWADRGTLVAVVAKASLETLQVDIVHLLDIADCSNIEIKDLFPGLRFSMRGDTNNFTIQDFEWDGGRLFALIGPQRNDGFGFINVYDYIDASVRELDPLDKNCCYRDIRWSPDSNYIMFAFQDILGGANSVTELYYLPYGTIGNNQQYTPIPLPDTFFPEARSKPQPALRSAP